MLENFHEIHCRSKHHAVLCSSAVQLGGHGMRIEIKLALKMSRCGQGPVPHNLGVSLVLPIGDALMIPG